MFNIFKLMGLNEISWEMGGYGERRSLMTEPRDMATVGCPGSEEESVKGGRPRFLDISTTNSSGKKLSVVGNGPVHYRMFNSITSLYLVITSNTFLSQV